MVWSSEPDMKLSLIGDMQRETTLQRKKKKERKGLYGEKLTQPSTINFFDLNNNEPKKFIEYTPLFVPLEVAEAPIIVHREIPQRFWQRTKWLFPFIQKEKLKKKQNVVKHTTTGVQVVS